MPQVVAYSLVKSSQQVDQDEGFASFVGDESMEAWRIFRDTAMESSVFFTRAKETIDATLGPKCQRLKGFLGSCELISNH